MQSSIICDLQNTTMTPLECGVDEYCTGMTSVDDLSLATERLCVLGINYAAGRILH